LCPDHSWGMGATQTKPSATSLLPAVSISCRSPEPSHTRHQLSLMSFGGSEVRSSQYAKPPHIPGTGNQARSSSVVGVVSSSLGSLRLAGGSCSNATRPRITSWKLRSIALRMAREGCFIARVRNGLTTKLTDSHERRRGPRICKDARHGAHGCWSSDWLAVISREPCNCPFDKASMGSCKKVPRRMLRRPEDKRPEPAARQSHNDEILNQVRRRRWERLRVTRKIGGQNVPSAPDESDDNARLGLKHNVEYVIAASTEVRLWNAPVVCVVSPIEVRNRSKCQRVLRASECCCCQHLPSRIAPFVCRVVDLPGISPNIRMGVNGATRPASPTVRRRSHTAGARADQHEPAIGCSSTTTWPRSPAICVRPRNRGVEAHGSVWAK